MKWLRVLLTDFARAFYAPRALYRDIAEGRKSPSWAFVLVYCLYYVGGVIWLYANHFEPFATQWLRLDPKTYYLVEAFFILPVVFAAWILGAAVIRTLSMLVRGQGRFEVLLRMTGYSLWAPFFLLAIVDSIHATPEWLYTTVLSICAILVPVGTTIAVKVEEKVHIVLAAVIALVGIGATGIVTYTYIR